MTTYRVPVLEDFSWQPPIEDKDLETAPTGAGVTKGKRYIVAANGGNWSGGAAKDIATAKQTEPADPAHWMFDTPEEGWTVHVKDEDVNYVFDGSTWGKSPADDNAASIDSLEVVASAAIDSIDSLETVASAAISSIDSLELIDSTNTSTNVVQNASIDSLETVTSAAIDSVDSLETVASAAISSVDSLESEISTNKSLDLASIDSLELIDSANASVDVVQDASINSLELVDSTNLSTEVADVASIDAAKQDKGTYVSEYGAIEFTI